MKKLAFAFAFLFALVLLFTPAGADNAKLDFALINKTGYGIKSIFISPSTETEWGSNILSAVLENNEQVAISFDENATAEKWDLKIEWVDGGDPVVWKACKLTEITKLTLHYDRASGDTSADSE